MDTQVVPWRGADTYKGLLQAMGASVSVLLLQAVLGMAGLAGDGAPALAPAFLLEGVLLWAAWRFSVRRHRLGWGALGFRSTVSPVHIVLLLAVLIASLLFSAAYTLIVLSPGPDRVISQ